MADPFIVPDVDENGNPLLRPDSTQADPALKPDVINGDPILQTDDYAGGGGGGGSGSVLVFKPNYDGNGTSRRIYVTNGFGEAIPYPTGTIDRLVVTGDDPRYVSAVAASPVLAMAVNLPVVDGDVVVNDALLTTGAVSNLTIGRVVWFQLWNLDGSYSAVGTIIVMPGGTS